MNLPSTTFHTFKFIFHCVMHSALALTNYLTYENNMLRARADELHQEKDVENIVKHKVRILEYSFSEKMENRTINILSWLSYLGLK
jgi:hypothetical protein